MVKVVRGREGAFIVYVNGKYVGLIVAKDIDHKFLYQAIDKLGQELGISSIYGEALELILAVPHGAKYHTIYGDD